MLNTLKVNCMVSLLLHVLLRDSLTLFVGVFLRGGGGQTPISKRPPPPFLSLGAPCGFYFELMVLRHNLCSEPITFVLLQMGLSSKSV